jgi:hypothetical protein
MENNAEKTKPFRDKAVETKKISKDIYDQLEKYKQTYETNKEEILRKAKERYQEKHPEAKTHNRLKEEKKLNYYLSKKLKKNKEILTLE